MARPLLKPHASLFAALLRALDPVIALAVAAAAFSLYRPEVITPEPYLMFAGAGAVTIVALFPAFGLYDPQRGASLADELRNLLLAWLVIAALAAGALFATKSGEAFSRVWVATWLAGGLLATTLTRIAYCASVCAHCADMAATFGTSRSWAPAHLEPASLRTWQAPRGPASLSRRSTTTTQPGTAHGLPDAWSWAGPSVLRRTSPPA